MDFSANTPPGCWIGRTYLIQGTSFVTSPFTNKLCLILIGGGGGGGGTPTTSSNTASAGGGGAGAYAEKIDISVTPNTAYTYAIGAGGAGGAAGTNPGQSGGDTTFTIGSLTITAPGGSGGAGGVAASTGPINGGAGGTAPTNADFGYPGDDGLGAGTESVPANFPGTGGYSLYGAVPVLSLLHSTRQNGPAGGGYGTGGGGAYNNGASGTNPGGAGAGGIIIVDEYT